MILLAGVSSIADRANIIFHYEIQGSGFRSFRVNKPARPGAKGTVFDLMLWQREEVISFSYNNKEIKYERSENEQ